MKALTICQPYAGAILDGRKRVENRSWKTKYRGELIIHAGKSQQWLKSWDAKQDGPLPEPMAYGAVVGIATLADCCDLRDAFYFTPDQLWIIEHHHASGPICWVLENVRKLETPIPWVGKQGLWNGSYVVKSDAWKNNTLIDVEPR